MKNFTSIPVLLFGLLVSLTIQQGYAQSQSGSYTLVVEGFDWGAAASKVILHMEESLTSLKGFSYSVSVKRSSPCMKEEDPNASGEREVIAAFVSDEEGNPVEKGEHITLILEVGPHLGIGSPIQYFSSRKCNGNQWVAYELTITERKTQQVWKTESKRMIPLIDEFDLSGSFAFNEDITLKYASYVPVDTEGKVPLIIWLHGGGEGGTDPRIVLLANRAANYASPEIQEIFGGAHVLVPQSPTFWMQNAQGGYTRGKVNDIYNESLMGLFDEYIKQHPDIDVNRIYVGGCSNGGYMSQKLLLNNPNYFAAAFPSALAYFDEFLSEEDIASLAKQSIWYIHSKDDPVTKADKTIIPTYQRIMDVGAKDVHLSLYDHVTDLYGTYGGEAYHYNGHFSWIYSHRNHCSKTIDGKKISLMEWMASKSR